MPILLFHSFLTVYTLSYFICRSLTVASTVTALVAYYGPNGAILGNIRNDCRDFIAITDLSGLLTKIFRMLCLDGMVFVITVTLLWKFVSVNGINVVLKEIRHYGPFICLILSGGALKVYILCYSQLKIVMLEKIILT